eukprot:TRINITY_DN1852_c0_g1_i2.p1 TRINITY_DN1852_c0_g1~~TRINITY_DN1852_c0_g1_i2.p1  ORF type:complete len:130 (-),score=19.26 TRINITY_DN1852_c0_g1_i2:119-508(-)
MVRRLLMLRRLLVMLRLVLLLWVRHAYFRNLHIRNTNVRDVNIRDLDVRNVNVRHIHRREMNLMASIMTMACWWCASFLSSYSLNSFRQNLCHYFSLPPPNIVLHTSRPLTVLGYGPCRAANIGLPSSG